jgi:arylsulfatase A-like enzyme
MVRALARWLSLVAFLGVLALGACTSSPPVELSQPSPQGLAPSPTLVTPCPTATPRPQMVVIISVDGLAAGAFANASTPYLDSLWQEGAYSWSAQTVLPSATLPAHASMVSGLDVPTHGITWNDWLPERGYLRLPTVFTLAKEAGLKVAAFVGKAKLRHLMPPGAVDHFAMPGYWAKDIVPEAVDYLLRERPQLLFIHLPDPDTVGHDSGWFSPDQLAAISQVDQAIGLLLEALRREGLWDTTLIIVTSDHGGHDRVHGSDDPRDTTIPWMIHGPGVRKGVELQGPIRVLDTAPTALWALGIRPPEEWEGRPVREAFAPEPVCARP